MSVLRCCWPSCYELVRPALPLCQTHAMRVYWTVFDEHPAAADRPAERPRRRDTSRPGTVYFVKIGERVKLGWTADLDRRLRSYPPGRTLLASEAGTLADEAALHQRCTPWRCDGREWYTPTPALLAVVEEVRKRDALRARMENQQARAQLLARMYNQKRVTSVPFSSG